MFLIVSINFFINYYSITVALPPAASIFAFADAEKIVDIVNIYGGRVTSYGGPDGAGIGSVWAVTIAGGIVEAHGGGSDAPGIGCRYEVGSFCNVTITGGTVTATGGYSAAGIGSGEGGSCTVILSGGDIKATGGGIIRGFSFDRVAGIGSGFNGTCNLTDLRLDKDKWEGKGTAAAPYQISNAEQLTELAKKIPEGTVTDGVYFTLTKDLEYSGQPIGSEGHPFKGILDGSCHKITLNINKENTGAALFYETDGATVKNLEVAGSVSGKDCVGGIVGHAYGNTLIDNCHVTASVKGTEVNIGGVVGILSDSTVSNCRVDATVEGGYTNVGGIVGWLHNNSKVVNCVKTGKTSGYKAKT